MTISKPALRLASVATLLVLGWAAPLQAQGIKHLPADTEVIVTVNLQQVWSSKLVKDYNALIKQLQSVFNTKLDENQIVAEFRESLGIDPLKDIDVITAGTSEMGKKPKSMVIVLEGKFKVDKFAQTAKKGMKDYPEFIKEITINNTTVYQITKPGEETFFMSLPNKNLFIIANSKETMTTAIAPQAQNLKKEMTDLLKNANLKKSFNMVMTAAVVEEAIKQGNNPQAQAISPFLKDLHGAILSANVVSDIELNWTLAAKDAAAAKQMAEQLTAGLGLAKAAIAGKKNQGVEQAMQVLNTLKASADGSNVTVTGNVPRKVLDTALQAVENFLP